MKVKDLFQVLSAAPVRLVDQQGGYVGRIDEGNFDRLLSEYGEYAVVFIQPDVEIEMGYDYGGSLVEVSRNSLYTVVIYK